MASFDLSVETLRPDAMKLHVKAGHDRLLTRGEVISLWKSDAAFDAFFSSALGGAPYAAFFWEMPPLTPQSVDAPFECVLLSSAALARQKADPAPFAEHIALLRGRSDVVVFANLGGDADLIAPCDCAAGADYAHLAVFLRTAPGSQQAALWSALAAAVEPWLARGERFWLSTAGLGVSWVHVRIDSRPKYYRHTPYTIF